MTTSPNSGRRSSSSREAGSAYLFALLVLFILTVIGLSLAIVTQSEVQIGGAEKVATRTLYQDDAALRVQLASVFFNDTKARDIQLNPDINLGTSTLKDRVRASAFFPIYSGPCALCSLNTGNIRYWDINHVVSSVATRKSDVSGTETVYAEKTLSQMFALQPLQERSIESFREDNENSIRY